MNFKTVHIQNTYFAEWQMDSRILVVIIVIYVFTGAAAFAGPPFQTDDPEPVEYKHWEVYVASQGSFDQDGTSVTAPMFEVNYGVAPDVQLHLIAPFEYVKPEGGPSHYGYEDTETGVKFRFIHI